jgi:hypothetical protein
LHCASVAVHSSVSVLAELGILRLIYNANGIFKLDPVLEVRTRPYCMRGTQSVRT